MAELRAVRQYLEEHRGEMLADLEDFVGRETPSEDKRLLDSFAEYLGEYAERGSGGRATVIPNEKAGDQVRVEWGGDEGEAPILLLGHYDTVWPAGTLETMPFAVRGDVASGPGVFDMKCGLVQGLWGVKALRQAGVGRRITLLCNSDEELGSPHSRRLVEEAALESRATLVLEPSVGGALKTSRKGQSRYVVRVTGQAAHTGLDPEKGVSAVEELARMILELHGHNDPRSGTTVNVGVIRGGSRHNVVAAGAEAEVDVRFTVPEEESRMDALVRGLRPRLPGAGVEIEGGEVWPAMQRDEKIAGLFETARRVGAELGMEIEEAAAGGSSDGCTCAALGVPVLDGLGAVGAGAHAEDEHVAVSAIPSRAALISGLLAEL